MAVHAAKMRWNPNRSTDVTAKREMAESGRESRGAAARRTAGRAGEVPRIIRRAVDRVVALQIGEHHGHIGFPRDDRAGFKKSVDGDGILLRAKVRILRNAGGGGHAFHAIAFFHSDRNTVEGSPPFLLRQRAVRFASSRERLL